MVPGRGDISWIRIRRGPSGAGLAAEHGTRVGSSPRERAPATRSALPGARFAIRRATGAAQRVGPSTGRPEGAAGTRATSASPGPTSDVHSRRARAAPSRRPEDLEGVINGLTSPAGARYNWAWAKRQA